MISAGLIKCVQTQSSSLRVEKGLHCSFCTGHHFFGWSYFHSRSCFSCHLCPVNVSSPLWFRQLVYLLWVFPNVLTPLNVVGILHIAGLPICAESQFRVKLFIPPAPLAPRKSFWTKRYSEAQNLLITKKAIGTKASNQYERDIGLSQCIMYLRLAQRSALEIPKGLSSKQDCSCLPNLP